MVFDPAVRGSHVAWLDFTRTPYEEEEGIMARDYRKEYDNYHSSPKQRANRSSRVLARRKLAKTGAVRRGDGKDVHHKDGNPKNNSRSNLSVASRKTNRGVSPGRPRIRSGRKK